MCRLLSAERSPSSLQKRTEKSTVKVSAVDARVKKHYTQKDLKDTDGFRWLESTELATDKRKFLLNRLFVIVSEVEDEAD